MQRSEEEKARTPEALKMERTRLIAKRNQTKDADIIAALELRIRQIDAELPADAPKAKRIEPKAAEVAEPEIDDEASVPPPTPAQAAEADRLIRQARVERMRDNRKAASELLQKAVEVAPGSATVLEATGDDLAERKRMAEAVRLYRRAVALDPKNVALERKYATAVLTIESAGSLDDQMRMHLSDSPFLSSDDRIASLPMATLLSAILPGLGHLVMGQTARGFGILAAWILSSIWLVFNVDEIAKFLAFARGGTQQPNLVFLAPCLIMMIIYIATLATFKNMADTASRKKIDHPVPPVNLPFE